MAKAGARRGWLRYRVVVFFLLGLLGVEVAVVAWRHVWRAYDPDDYRIKLHECRRRAPDCVVVGGSSVSEGIDPTVLAGVAWQGRPLQRPFNLGLPGATTTEVWHAVKNGIGTPPRLLIYGVTATDLNERRNEPHGIHSLMRARDLADWARLRPQSAGYCVRHYARSRLDRAWSLYHFRNGIRVWAAHQVDRWAPGSFPEAAKEAADGLRYSAALRRGHGFAPRPEFQAGNLENLLAVGNVPAVFPFMIKYELGGHQRYLGRILDWGEANGASVLLVDMPVSAHLQETMHPAEFAAYAAALANLERERGVKVLRPTRAALGLAVADYADLAHLNASGVRKLSTWLRDALAADAAPRQQGGAR